MTETKHTALPQPVAWVIPGDDTARVSGAIDAMAWQEGEFTRPLYDHPPVDPNCEPVAWQAKWTNGAWLTLNDDSVGNRAKMLLKGYQIRPLYSAVNSHHALKQRVEELEAALRRIGQQHDCGCKPCTGQCVSLDALASTIAEMREVARSALSPRGES